MAIKKNILNKMYLVSIIMMLILVVIIGKVINLQYFQDDKYKKIAEQTTLKRDTVKANRGNVFASDGSLLATSVTRFTISMNVKSVKNKIFENNVEALSQELSNLLGNTKDYYLNKLRYARKEQKKYQLIARNVAYDDYLKIKTFPMFNLGIYKSGLMADPESARVHPIGKIAERTVGYDYKDYRGGAGIEGAFSEYLEGKAGWRSKQKIAKGQWKPINDVNEKEPEDGRDIVTTIDVNIQDITHHALLKQLKYFNADHGCAVVMETETGEIRAISNLGKTKKGSYYEKRNYAVWESNEPGSTFKLASLMVALEDKVIDTSTVVNTGNGKMIVHGKKIEDTKEGGYGRISVGRVFEVSSNVGIVKAIGKHYNHQPKKFTDRIKSFGLGKKTGVNIKGEGEPFILLPSNKKRWSKISLRWMLWGYGVSLTPLQMLTFYNAVANKGEMVKPRFVKELRFGGKVEKKFDKVVLKEQIASEETLKKVIKVMENVVKKGTAENIYSPNFSMAGKTGTTKKWIPKHKNKEGKVISGHYSNKKYIASFAGFFPVKNPKYSCIVVIHEPEYKKGYYGAKVAAPVFKEIAHKIYSSTPVKNKIIADSVAYADINKNYEKYYKYIKKYKTIMPKVVGMSGMDAIALLENMGLEVIYSGTGKVMEQSIKRGLKVSKGAKVYLKLS